MNPTRKHIRDLPWNRTWNYTCEVKVDAAFKASSEIFGTLQIIFQPMTILLELDTDFDPS